MPVCNSVFLGAANWQTCVGLRLTRVHARPISAVGISTAHTRYVKISSMGAAKAMPTTLPQRKSAKSTVMLMYLKVLQEECLRVLAP